MGLSGKWLRSLLFASLLLAALAQDDAAAGGEETTEEGAAGEGCPFELTLPWTYGEEIEINLADRVQVEDEDSPLALSTTCKCPLNKPQDTSVTCVCDGPNSDDCDPYAQLLAIFFLSMEKFAGIFLHMDTIAAKYHIANVVFWSILGGIFIWSGIIILLYSEIKAVIIVRERDERERLVLGGYLTENESKIAEIRQKEESSLLPRPYLTIGGGFLYFIGLVCQFTPFCDVFGLIYPGIEFFHGFCYAFVILGSSVLALCTFLFTIGLCWSCTRPWAAVVLIGVGLLGELMLFGGIVSIVIWTLVAIGVFYIYFKWAPEYFDDKHKDYPAWLQDLGNFWQLSSSAEDWKQAASLGGEGLKAESRGIVEAFPGGKWMLQQGDSASQAVSDAAGGLTSQSPNSGTV